MVFDDTYGTVQGNDNPTRLGLRAPLKLVASNTTFQQDMDRVPMGAMPYLVIGALLVGLLLLSHYIK